MRIRKFLRTILGQKYILLNKLLLQDGICFNWEPIWNAAGDLSRKDQRKLGKLIANYVHGYTVTVHNEHAFMYCAVRAYKEMNDHSDQAEFDTLIRLIHDEAKPIILMKGGEKNV